MTPAELRQRAASAETEAQARLETIAAENRDATEDEQAEIDGLIARAANDDKLAKRLEDLAARVESRSQGQGRITSPAATWEPGESQDDKLFRTGGFVSAGHFFHSIARGQPSTAAPEDSRRLHEWRSCVHRVNAGRQRAVQGMNVSVGPDGGDLIPPDYSNTIWDRAREENDVMRLVDFMPIQGNTWKRPALAETSRANGSRMGGIRGYWEGEGDDATATRPTYSSEELRLKKLMCVVAYTSEMDEDVPMMASWLTTNVPREIGFVMQDALINGSGAGMPRGIKDAACVVSVAKESGQAAATVNGTNITKMWSRLYAPCRKNAVWLYNQDVEPQLDQLYFATGSNSGQLIYTPPTGISGSTYSTLKGRPMIPIEQCQTLGTVGDIILVDLTQITAIRKASGVRADVSMHVYFLSDQSVMRFVTRVDYQPSWAAALTPFKGSNSQSPIVTLATRA